MYEKMAYTRVEEREQASIYLTKASVLYKNLI